MESSACGQLAVETPGWPRLRGGSLALFAVLVALQACLVVVGSRHPLPLLMFGCFLVACWISVRSTLAGLVLVILFQARVLEGTEGIGIEEIAFAVLFLSMLTGWFLRHGRAPEGKRVLGSPIGRSILLFMLICLASIVPRALYGGGFEWWLRGLYRFSYLLLFFPIATTLKTRRAAAILVACFAFVAVFYVMKTVLMYRSMVSVAEEAWQVVYQRVADREAMPMATLACAVAIFLRARSKAVLLLMALLSTLCIVSLAASQSRTYWVASALAVGLVVFLSRDRASRAVSLGLILAGAAVLVGYATFGLRSAEIVTGLASRASTIATPLRSLSIQERMAETEAVIDLIRANPIIGYGLGAPVSHMSPARHCVVTKPFTHNAYLFLVLKLGVIGAVVFFVFYFRGIRRVWQALKRSSDIYVRATMTAGLSLLVAFMPLSALWPQFYARKSLLIIVLILGAAEAIAGREEASPPLGFRGLQRGVPGSRRILEDSVPYVPSALSAPEG